jgi:hypothetical protein
VSGAFVHLEFTTETARVGVDLAEGQPITLEVSGTRASVQPGQTVEVPIGPAAGPPAVVVESA